MAPVVSIRRGKRAMANGSARDAINRIRRPLHQKLVGIDILRRQHADALLASAPLRKAQ